jgi:hypothetical protein
MDCSMSVALVSSTGCGGLQQAAATGLKLEVTRATLMGQQLGHTHLCGWCAHANRQNQ